MAGLNAPIIAPTSQPKDYSQIYWQGIAMRENAKAKKAKDEGDDWMKYMDKLKPKGDLHQSLVNKNNENYARALSNVQKARIENPNGWQMPTEREVLNANAQHEQLSGVNKTLKFFEALPDAQLDPFQRKMQQVTRTAKDTDEIVKAYLEDERSKNPNSGVLIDIDPNSPTYGAVGISGLSPNRNIVEEAKTVLTNKNYYDKTNAYRIKSQDGYNVDVEEATMSDEKGRELLSTIWDANQDTRNQYLFENRYSNDAKLANPKESYINDMLGLRGREKKQTVGDEKKENNFNSGSGVSTIGKVNYAVSKGNADNLLFKKGESFPENIGKKGDELTIVDFARTDANHNKPLVMYDENDNPVIAIPNKWIKNERTGEIKIMALKAQVKKGIESAVGEKRIAAMQQAVNNGDYTIGGTPIPLPYDKNEKGLAVELDGLTFDYAVKNSQGEVKQKGAPSGDKSKPKTDFRTKYKY